MKLLNEWCVSNYSLLKHFRQVSLFFRSYSNSSKENIDKIWFIYWLQKTYLCFSGRYMADCWCTCESRQIRSARNTLCPLYFSNTILTCINFSKILTYFEAKLQKVNALLRVIFKTFYYFTIALKLTSTLFVNDQLQYLGKFVEKLVTLYRWSQNSNPQL